MTLRLRLLNKMLLLKLALLQQHLLGQGSGRGRAAPSTSTSKQNVLSVLLIKPALLSSSCWVGAAREAGPHLLPTVQRMRALSTGCLFNAALSISAEEVVSTVDVSAKL